VILHSWLVTFDEHLCFFWFALSSKISNRSIASSKGPILMSICHPTLLPCVAHIERAVYFRH
jgi:hypothetical protein